jgi:glutaredoxin-like protein NrdH
MSQDVTLYALSTCEHCKRCKEFLEILLGQDGFKCHYIDRLIGEERNNRTRELRRVNSQFTFPTVIIGEEVVIGNKQDTIKELLGK